MTELSRCPLCNGQPLGPKFPGAHHWLHCCPDCGLGMCNPQPTDEELAEIYSAEYYSQFGYSGRTGDAALARIKQATYAGFLKEAERLLPATGPAGGPRRLLDVGCGLGYSLLGGHARGWDVAGVEPHALAGRGLPADLAAKIIRGSLDDVARTGRRFDLVSLIDVIEHVRDPVATIRQAALLLAPGGVLMLATNSQTSRGARSPRWVHFHRAHLWYFSPGTLSAAVAKAGMAVRHTGTAWRVYNLQYVASILGGSGNAPVKRAAARISLRLVPRRLRLMRWPALPEGMLLLAT